jgi:hypothetical protein
MSATSSQYYRSASAHSHYPNFPTNNNEQLYALAAASWHQDPDHASYAGPASATFLHYAHAGADSGGHTSASSSAPLPWPTGYARQDLQGWEQPASDHTYASRSDIHYGAAEGSATVPHPTASASRQYQQQQTLNTRQDLPLTPSCDTYRSTDRFQELRITSVCAHTGNAIRYTRLRLMFTRHPPQMWSTHLSRLMPRDSIRFLDPRILGRIHFNT